jgi:hypothetical protein
VEHDARRHCQPLTKLDALARDSAICGDCDHDDGIVVYEQALKLKGS